MSDLILFGVGFLLFAVTTTATMWFGYQQFNRIYRSDLASGSNSRILAKDSSNNEFRVDATHMPDGLEPVGGRGPESIVA